MIDVTIVIASYNPIYEKLKRTLLSALYQKDVSMQIVVADDGSKENYFSELEKIFKESGFDEYVLLSSERNHGTISNLMRTRDHIKGAYVKTISPGDYLYDTDTLKKWFEFCSENNLDVCFGDAAYYHYDNAAYKVFAEYILPQNAKLYTDDGRNQKNIILNYFLLKDAIVGALYLIKTGIMYSYLGRLENTITYTEDNMFRLMLLDGMRIVHIPLPVVYYEYGVGISTNKNQKWIDTLDNEYRVVDKLIYESGEWTGFFNDRIKYLLKIKDNKKKYTLMKYLLFPGLVFWQIKKRFFKEYSKTDYDSELMHKIHEQG